VIRFIGRIYYLISPCILGGVANMLFMKLPLLNSLRRPMDLGRSLKDGYRILGDNKTFKGFIGMVAFSGLGGALFWQGLFAHPFLAGLWAGFAYAIAELPNSFIKRRLALAPGHNGGPVQTFFDQSDSVIGFLVLMPLIYRFTPYEWFATLLIATGTHYLFNVLLYLIGLRGQKG